jgi:hypothetical protein
MPGTHPAAFVELFNIYIEPSINLSHPEATAHDAESVRLGGRITRLPGRCCRPSVRPRADQRARPGVGGESAVAVAKCNCLGKLVCQAAWQTGRCRAVNRVATRKATDHDQR